MFFKKLFIWRNGIEIITISGKNYYFNFYDKEYRNNLIIFFSQDNNFIKIMLNTDNKNNIENYLVFIKLDKTFFKEEIKVIEFVYVLKKHYFISNYKLLILMNLLSNRSFCDLFQYPIFPWIIYNEEIEKNKNKFRIQERNLNVQMGELLYNNDDKRIKMFKDSYELMSIELKNNNYKLDDNY